jgi:hypothetical protein
VEIADSEASCIQYWPYKPGSGRSPGQNVKLPRGFIGQISVEVTEDVLNGTHTWSIQELNKLGGAAFISSEGAEELGQPELAPTLILHVATDGT